MSGHRVAPSIFGPWQTHDWICLGRNLHGLVMTGGSVKLPAAEALAAKALWLS
jgi:hypothetical protein